MSHIPKINIIVDKNADIDRFHRFLKHPEYLGKRFLILQFYPKLASLLTESTDEQRVVRDFVLKMYERHSPTIKKIILTVKKEIDQSEPVFAALGKYMDFPYLKDQTYIAIPTFLPFSPLMDDIFFFTIASLQIKPFRAVSTAIHEISHFIFFKQLKQWSDVSGRTLNHPATHYFKEALAAAVMNQPEFKSFFNYDVMLNMKNYPGNKELQQLFISDKNRQIVNLVSFFRKNIVIYKDGSYRDRLYKLLNTFFKNQDKLSVKWNLWNEHLIHPENESLLFQYKKPIELV